MGLRAYLLVEVADDVEQQQFIAALRKLEDTPGVDFVLLSSENVTPYQNVL